MEIAVREGSMPSQKRPSEAFWPVDAIVATALSSFCHVMTIRSPGGLYNESLLSTGNAGCLLEVFRAQNCVLYQV
jgi:hypothetical protein